MSKLTQAVRRTGLPAAVIHNFRFRRGTKTVRFECWWCVDQGRVPRDVFDADRKRYVDLLLAHIDSHAEPAASPEPHINPDCGICQVAGCTEHAVQCTATDPHTRDRHLRGKPYGSREPAASPEPHRD